MNGKSDKCSPTSSHGPPAANLPNVQVQARQVGDAVAARERRGDQGQQLVAGVRPPRRVTEVEVGVRQFTEAEPAGERGGEQQARVVHEAVVVEGDVYPVRRCSLVASNGCSLWL